MSGLHRTSLLGTVLLIACSSDTGKGYEIPESADLVDTPRALRLDVYPPGNLDLLHQTFTVLPEEIEDVYLALAPTLTVTGTVEGTIPSPVDITIPSSNTEPVEARITLEVPGTVMRAVTTSDARGNYSVEVPSGVGYRAVAVALDPFDLPLYIEDNIVLNDTSPLNIQMGLGIPVSGIAQQTNGATLPTGSRVRLIDDFRRIPPARVARRLHPAARRQHWQHHAFGALDPHSHRRRHRHPARPRAGHAVHLECVRGGGGRRRPRHRRCGSPVHRDQPR
jgi:hypothetical protein